MNRGLPRPKFDDTHWPHPYSASDDGIATISEERADECRENVLCGVCGEKITGEFVWVIHSTSTDPYYSNNNVRRTRQATDSLAFHKRCAKMTMRWCPHMKMPEANAKMRRITKRWYKRRYSNVRS